MTTKTITRSQRSEEIVRGEIESLSLLIEKRNVWLNDELNQKRSTWEAVNKDTANMRGTLRDLKEEYDELLKKNKKWQNK